MRIFWCGLCMLGLISFWSICGAETIGAQDAAAAVAPAAARLSWPQVFVVDGRNVTFYQPQVDDWKDYKTLKVKCAVSVQAQDDKPPVFGAVYLQAQTLVNHPDREVLLSDFQAQKVYFPQTQKELANRCEAVVRGVVAGWSFLRVSLDQTLAVAHGAPVQRETPADLSPPPVYFAQTPAILVVFLGKPKFEMIDGTGLLFATNTNWDLLLDPASSRYYLLNGTSWLTTTNLEKGEWTPAGTLPVGLQKLPADDNWQALRQNIPGTPATTVPTVVVSLTPAELIVTAGAPQFEPIAGTSLFAVSNTESDVFMQAGKDGIEYYLLAAGRWFRAPSLNGPWSEATRSLPADFARIPQDDPHSFVLSSVPGTPDAQAAVLLASVPKKATVKRSEAAITVSYWGTPVFAAIDGTSLFYAVNTPYAVIRAGDSYYCCSDGVWFVAGSASGPWAVAPAVPQAIYTIPPSNPLYNVTYVTVYESTPETVTVGYTAGYTGEFIAAGLVMFGLGYAIGHNWDEPWCAYHSAGYFCSYGCSVRFSYYNGNFIRSGSEHVYGPYGGAGRGAIYNPATGAYARGAYAYGPRGSVAAGIAYNPSTGFAAGRVGGSSVYGSWGKAAVTNGQGWAEAGYHATARGTVGGIETSAGTKAVVAQSARGNTTGVAKAADGDVYVGRDGNLYRKADGGGWQKYNNDNWQPVTHSQPDNAQQRHDGEGGADEARQQWENRERSVQDAPQERRDNVRPEGEGQPAAGEARRASGGESDRMGEADSSGARWREEDTSDLDREAVERRRGNERSESFDDFRSDGGRESGRFYGGGRGHFRR